MQAEAFQHLFGAGGHALVLGHGLLGRGDRDHLHLDELMLADHAPGVAPRSPRLGAETGGQRGDAHGQGLLVENFLAHQIGQRHLGGGDQPEVLARAKLVVAELRELRGAIHGVVAHQHRRVHLFITVVLGVQVQHELAQRPLQPRQRPAQDHEARTRHFCRPLEIHQAQRLADLEMLPGLEAFFEGRARSNDAGLHIIMLVGALGNLVERQIGQLQQRHIERQHGGGLGGGGAFGLGLDLGDAGLQLLGAGEILLAHGLADFLGEAVALLLAALGHGDDVAPGVIKTEQLRHGLLDLQSIPAPPTQARLEDFGIVADPADVMHGRRLSKRGPGAEPWNRLHAHTRCGRPHSMAPKGRGPGAVTKH